MRRYVTVDVFTDSPFTGNPLAVVLDAEGLDTAAMQAIATEFNYSETTFVLPPQDAAHSARVRIFTPTCEVPFAGHPNVGTAVVLAGEWQAAGRALPASFVFEELAGLVPVQLQWADGRVVGAELTAPEPLTAGPPVAVEAAARCLGLAPDEILTQTHAPIGASVGLPFLIVEVVSRAALARARRFGSPCRGAAADRSGRGLRLCARAWYSAAAGTHVCPARQGAGRPRHWERHGRGLGLAGDAATCGGRAPLAGDPR